MVAVMCQCPQRASTYFFQIAELTNLSLSTMCQCPQRASSYFFQKDVESLKDDLKVSMPSTGFYLFLHSMQKDVESLKDDVSMPSTGFYLFLQATRKRV